MGKTKGRTRYCPCCNSEVSLRTWYRHQNMQPVYPGCQAALSKRRSVPLEEVERRLLDDTAESDEVEHHNRSRPRVRHYTIMALHHK